MISMLLELTPDEQRKINKLFGSFENMAKGGNLPNTWAAFESSVRLTQNKLSSWAAGSGSIEGIPDNPKPSGSLAKSVKTIENGTLDTSVVSEDKRFAELQNGRPESEFDMKTKYPYGKKSRVSDKGIPYLIIPFRWGTPNGHNTKRAHFSNFIPEYEYHTSVKPMDMSLVTGTKPIPEPNASGENIIRASYSWGDRLKNAWHKNAEGMVRMSGKSGYFTFRIISANSPKNSWIRHYSEQPPIKISEALQNDVSPIITRKIQRALQQDIRALNGN